MTPRQGELYKYIRRFIQKRGYPPTYSEMCEGIKVKSKNSITKLLKSLEKQVIKLASTPRGIRYSRKLYELSKELAEYWPTY